MDTSNSQEKGAEIPLNTGAKDDKLEMSIVNFLFDTARLDPRTVSAEKWMEVLKLVLNTYRPRGKYFPFVTHSKEKPLLHQVSSLLETSAIWIIEDNHLAEVSLRTGIIHYAFCIDHDGGERHEEVVTKMDTFSERLIPLGICSGSCQVIEKVFPVAGSKPREFHLFIDTDMDTWWALKKYDTFAGGFTPPNESNRINHLMHIKEEEVLNMIKINRFTAIQIIKNLNRLSEIAIQKKEKEAQEWRVALFNNQRLLAKLTK